MAGLLQPRPRALVSFYGYGDIDGVWYSQPNPYYSQPAPVSPEVAYLGTGTAMLTSSAGEAYQHRGSFYLYCRQQGLWPKEITGHNPHTDPRAFDAYCPIRQITAAYPPTLLLHGDQDMDVPFEQSEQMDIALTQHQVPHQFVQMKGFGHAFDLFPAGEPQKIDEAFDAVLAFLSEHTA